MIQKGKVQGQRVDSLRAIEFMARVSHPMSIFRKAFQQLPVLGPINAGRHDPTQVVDTIV